jgi:hypothetical protein
MWDQPGVAQGWIQSFIGQKRTSEITLIACILYDTHNDQVVYLLIKKKMILQVKRKKALQFSKLWMWGTLKTDSNWTEGSQVDPVAWSLKSAHKRVSKAHSSLPTYNPHCLRWCTPDSKGVGLTSWRLMHALIWSKHHSNPGGNAQSAYHLKALKNPHSTHFLEKVFIYPSLTKESHFRLIRHLGVKNLMEVMKVHRWKFQHHLFSCSALTLSCPQSSHVASLCHFQTILLFTRF